jgi:hypothetical protein
MMAITTSNSINVNARLFPFRLEQRFVFTPRVERKQNGHAAGGLLFFVGALRSCADVAPDRLNFAKTMKRECYLRWSPRVIPSTITQHAIRNVFESWQAASR